MGVKMNFLSYIKEGLVVNSYTFKIYYTLKQVYMQSSGCNKIVNISNVLTLL